MTERRALHSYLTREFIHPIRDPLWGHIYLTGAMKSIVTSHRFQRLNGIRQLGPAFLVYPGATHTRLNHSLGVFEIAKRTLLALLRSDELDFVTVSGAKAFLCASLLHDLGHFPYAHSLKELPLAEHERLTARFIRDSELYDLIRNHVGTDPNIVAAIVDLHETGVGGEELQLYRQILSGVLDPDKLDYLNRDAYFCGVSYGTQDIDFVLSKLTYQQEFGMMLGVDGLTAVENVLFSKYLMYRAVYWHRSVRAATAMIKKAVSLAMIEGEIVPEDLYGIDDAEFEEKLIDRKFHSFDLIRRVSRRELHTCVHEAPAEATPELVDRLSDLGRRAVFEATVAAHLAHRLGRPVPTEAIVIDIPEPISFESDLTIDLGDRRMPFPESGSVFDRGVVAGFSRSLRRIGLFVDSNLATDIQDPAWLMEIRDVGIDGVFDK